MVKNQRDDLIYGISKSYLQTFQVFFDKYKKVVQTQSLEGFQ